jgi:hypothetical protein
MKTEHLEALLLARQLSSSGGLVGDCQRSGDRSGLVKELPAPEGAVAHYKLDGAERSAHEVG